jgi:hypothetical protein
MFPDTMLRARAAGLGGAQCFVFLVYTLSPLLFVVKDFKDQLLEALACGLSLSVFAAA